MKAAADSPTASFRRTLKSDKIQIERASASEIYSALHINATDKKRASKALSAVTGSTKAAGKNSPSKSRN